MNLNVTLQRSLHKPLCRARFWRWSILLICLILVMPLPIQSWAQLGPPILLPPVFDPTGRSTKPRPLEEEKPLEPAPPLLTPEKSPEEFVPSREIPSLKVFVRSIHVVGSTVFSEQQLSEVTNPYLNRLVTTEEFERLRLELTMLYINKGYVTSGGVIPDQDVTGGDVTIQIIEGKLVNIGVEGNKTFRSSYYQKRIQLGVDTPLNIDRIQERLQLLQQDQRIQRLNAELKPGAQRGESELAISVTEDRPFKAWVDFNNYQTPVVGAERALGTIQHQSLTGHGDIMSFTYGGSKGVNPIIDTYYSLPLNAYDTTLILSYRRNDFVVVESPFDPLDIKSKAEIYTVTLQQPFYRTVNQQVSLFVTGEYLHNETTLLGEPFSFVTGANNGVSNIAAIRATPEWIYRTPASVIAARSRFSFGIDALNATINPSPAATARFFSWLGQLQGVHRFDRLGGTQVIGRIDAQLADKHLFPLEQIPLGGRFSVRGYRENTLVRDNGILASVEVRIPLYRSVRGEDVVQLAPFVDYGSGWNNFVSTAYPRYLASVGTGLRWNILPQERARFEIYWGQQLNHYDTGNGTLQDHGIHLQLVVQVY